MFVVPLSDIIQSPSETLAAENTDEDENGSERNNVQVHSAAFVFRVVKHRIELQRARSATSRSQPFLLQENKG